MSAVADPEARSWRPEVPRGVRLAILCVVCAAGLTPCRAGEPPENVQIRLSGDATRIEVTGVAPRRIRHIEAYHSGLEPAAAVEGWAHLLAVRVAGQTNDAPTVLGAFTVDRETIVFTPRFPLRAGLTYHVTYNGGEYQPFAGPPLEVTPAIETDLTIAAERRRPPTTITAVYPSGGELPENLLKFYIHFSAPMRRGEAYDHIRILDAAGRDVPDAFLRLGEELWDADARRLTLLFDPGRIKRGLKPNEEDGAPLMAGRRYSLVIDGAWRDSHRTQLAGGYHREFHVTPFDDVQPDPQRWQVTAPHADSREPLVVEFNEPLDHALLEHSLVVQNPRGAEVTGSIAIDEDEMRWQLTPDEPWDFGKHALVVDAILEDRAGNSVGRLFETQTQEVVDQGTSAEPVTLHFLVKPR